MSPTPDRVERLIRSAIYSYEEQFFTTIYQKLSNQTCEGIDRLINHLEKVDDSPETEEALTFHELKSDPGRIGVVSAFPKVTTGKPLYFCMQMLSLLVDFK